MGFLSDFSLTFVVEPDFSGDPTPLARFPATGGGSKNLNSVPPLVVEPAGEPGVDGLFEWWPAEPGAGMTPLSCGEDLPPVRPLTWVLEGRARARAEVFVVEFLRDRTPMLNREVCK